MEILLDIFKQVHKKNNFDLSCMFRVYSNGNNRYLCVSLNRDQIHSHQRKALVEPPRLKTLMHLVVLFFFVFVIVISSLS